MPDPIPSTQVWQQHVTSLCLHTSTDYKPLKPLRDIYQQLLSGRVNSFIQAWWNMMLLLAPSYCSVELPGRKTSHTCHQCPHVSINIIYTSWYFFPSNYLLRRETVQKLTDIVVIESLPFAACPANAILPFLWTLSSSVHVQQAAPNPFKNLQGLSVSVCESTLYKLWIAAGRKGRSLL